MSSFICEVCFFSLVFCCFCQQLSHVLFFVTPWTAALQASLSFTISWGLLKLMSIESVILSNHLILCRPLLLLPSVFPRIRVFSNELALCIRWPKYQSFSFSISPSNEHSGLISFSIYQFVSKGILLPVLCFVWFVSLTEQLESFSLCWVLFQ